MMGSPKIKKLATESSASDHCFDLLKPLDSFYFGEKSKRPLLTNQSLKNLEGLEQMKEKLSRKGNPFLRTSSSTKNSLFKSRQSNMHTHYKSTSGFTRKRMFTSPYQKTEVRETGFPSLNYRKLDLLQRKT